MPYSTSDSSADDNANAAASIYNDCLSYFNTLLQSDLISSNLNERKLLKKELGRLFLWGEDFQDGKLQDILRYSTDLSNTILRLLVAVSEALVKTYYRFDNNVADEHLDSMTCQLKDSLRTIKHLTRSQVDSCRTDDDVDEYDDDDDDEATSDEEDEESDHGINFYINLLMNLSPSMEQVYSQAMKDREDKTSVFPIGTGRHVAQLSRSSMILDGEKKNWDASLKTDSSTLIDKAFVKSLQQRFTELLHQGPKRQDRKLWPKIPIPPVEASMVRFQRWLHDLAIVPLQYENPVSCDEAISVIPSDNIYAKAENNHSLQQLKAASLDSAEGPQWGHQDCIIQALLRWFKNEFFSYVTNPPCTECSSPTTFRELTQPNEGEILQGGMKVELYQCSGTSCHQYVRFPRLGDAVALLKTRKGRAGEAAALFALLCRAMGARIRMVWCPEDYVWIEVYSEHQLRWIHVDPCEAAWDNPRIYTEGWGWKFSYCIAFSVDGATDVTRRYVRNFAVHGRDRYHVSEDVLIYILKEIQTSRRVKLDEREKSRLEEEDIREDEELQLYIVRRMTQKIIDRPQAISSNSPTDDSMIKTPNGSLEQSSSRG